MTEGFSEPPTALDAAIGLTVVAVGDGTAELRLDPPEIALGGTTPRPFLHGGALATCVDTAGWYAVADANPGEWMAIDLRCDFLRLAGAVPHRVIGRCLHAGRTLATADVAISQWDEPDRLVAVGRVRFARVVNS